MSVDATWLNPSSVSLNAQELRGVDGAFLAGSAGSAWGGIVRHGDSSLVVSVDGSDVATVQPGTAVIPGNAAAGQGPYRVSLPSVSSGALAARNATNPASTWWCCGCSIPMWSRHTGLIRVGWR